MALPELDEFRRQLELLVQNPALSAVRSPDGRYALRALSLDEVDQLMAIEAGYHLLLAATALNRTTLKSAASDDEALLVPVRRRRAHAVRARLPVSADLVAICERALTQRRGDLQRKARGQTEQLFRERLIAEGIPLLMSPPRREVPGVVISRRKPDGVWPDPASGAAPVLYLEIKRIRRVVDDIQKRLYELAEASLEMKLLYSDRTMSGLGLASNDRVGDPETARQIRYRVCGAPPFVIGLFLCPRAEAERYRTGAQSFIDRIFFQEEIDECIAFIDETIKSYPLG